VADLRWVRVVIGLTDEMRRAFADAAGWPPAPWMFGPDVDRGITAVLDLIEREQPCSARKGYETAIAVLRDVADRTGSPAAAWCADYLLVDPDRLAPPPQ
jgi:hypothetical protein